jgi:hypothetical protein
MVIACCSAELQFSKCRPFAPLSAGSKGRRYNSLPNGDCVIAKAEQFLAVLKDPKADKEVSRVNDGLFSR